MDENVEIESESGQKVKAILTIPEEEHGHPLEDSPAEKTLIIMVHGFPGDRDAHDGLFAELAAQKTLGDRHMLRFDFRGCGESEGRPENFTIAGACEDFQNILHWAKGLGFEKFAYVGEGLGGMLAIMNTDIPVQALALLWPVLDPRAYAENLYREDPDTETIDDGYILHEGQRIGINYVRELAKTDLKYALREVFMPTMIIHGAQDKTVPVEQLDMARNHMRAKRLEITNFYEGDHGFTHAEHRKMMFFHLTQFLARNA